MCVRSRRQPPACRPASAAPRTPSTGRATCACRVRSRPSAARVRGPSRRGPRLPGEATPLPGIDTVRRLPGSTCPQRPAHPVPRAAAMRRGTSGRPRASRCRRPCARLRPSTPPRESDLHARTFRDRCRGREWSQNPGFRATWRAARRARPWSRQNSRGDPQRHPLSGEWIEIFRLKASLTRLISPSGLGFRWRRCGGYIA
jgi:hypothetical protein